jgi:nucleotide-binding universal stress UspA family protein
MNQLTESGPRVVVGFDGSDCSRDALLFAADEARMRRLPLHVVRAYHPDAVGLAYIEVIDRREEYKAMLRGAIADSSAELTGIQLHADVMIGPVPQCLLSAARGATLLVVGSRGHGAVTRLLGSTAHAVVQHATCPVVVVHQAPAPEAIADPAFEAVPATVPDTDEEIDREVARLRPR